MCGIIKLDEQLKMKLLMLIYNSEQDGVSVSKVSDENVDCKLESYLKWYDRINCYYN